MSLAIPSLSSALQNLLKPITSAFTAPAIPKTGGSSYVSYGVSSPSAIAASKAPATPNMSVYKPPANMNVYTPPKSTPAQISAVNAANPHTGANMSYVNPADATASKGTVPYLPLNKGGMSIATQPTSTSVATGKPAVAGQPNAVIPSNYKAPAAPQITPTATRTSSASTPSAPAIPSFTASAAPAYSAPSYNPGGYDAGASGGTPTYTPSPSTYAASGMGGAGTTAPTGAGGIDMDKLLKEYQETLEPSDEEKAARKRLEQLNQSASSAYVNTEGQSIPLPFITGQQAQIQRSQALPSQPITSQLQDLSDYRKDRGTALKSFIDRQDEQSKPFAVSPGATYATYNSKTGAFNPLYTAPSSSSSAGGFSLAPGEVRYDANGKVIATGGTKPEDPKDVAAAAQKVRNATNQANDAITAIDKALGQTAGAFSTGLGSLSAAIPGSPAANLSATISTIKSVVAFQALQAMREASPTGGALGAVSDTEGRLLANSIAALDQSQSRDQLEANLKQVKTHFTNLLQIIQQGQSGGSSGGSSGGGWDALN